MDFGDILAILAIGIVDCRAWKSDSSCCKNEWKREFSFVRVNTKKQQFHDPNVLIRIDRHCSEKVSIKWRIPRSERIRLIKKHNRERERTNKWWKQATTGMALWLTSPVGDHGHEERVHAIDSTRGVRNCLIEERCTEFRNLWEKWRSALLR